MFTSSATKAYVCNNMINSLHVSFTKITHNKRTLQETNAELLFLLISKFTFQKRKDVKSHLFYITYRHAADRPCHVIPYITLCITRFVSNTLADRIEEKETDKLFYISDARLHVHSQAHETICNGIQCSDREVEAHGTYYVTPPACTAHL
jgi:hypothetical protein